jgi:biotin carboxyl carrier protein
LTFHVDANGRRYAVEVVERDGAFFVSIDGQQREVDVRQIEGGLSLIVGTRSYDVAIAPGRGDGTVVHVDGVPVEVVVTPERPSWATRGRTGAAQAAEGPQRVSAPMPGKVVKLLIKAGDRVEPRQGLVVVEAMKMENELRARAAGTVTQVRVAEGASVEAGAILVVIE